MSFVATDEDRAHLRRALELAAARRGRVSPNPIVGAVIVARRRDRSARASTPSSAACTPRSRRSPTARAPRRRPRPRRDDLRHPRALRAPGPPAAVHRGDPRRRPRPGGDRLRRPEREGIRPRPRDPARRGGRGRVRRRRRGRRGAARGAAVSQARPHRPAAGDAEVGGQPRRLHRDPGGDSRWISGPASRALVHRWRAEADAVAVGIGTALADDPLLTARDVDDPDAVRQPARVVFDSARAAAARLGAGRLARPRRRVYVFAATGADAARVEALRGAGAEVIELAGDRERRLARGARRARSPRGHLAAGRGRRRASPARCSTPARSTSCGCSSPRWCSAAGMPLAAGAGAGTDRRRGPSAGGRVEAERRGHARARAAAGVVMFTGIVRSSGPSRAIERGDDGARISVAAGFAGELRRGRLGLRSRAPA